MNAFIRKFLASNGGRYLLVGGSVYVLELLIIVLAQHLGAGPILAVALSFWIGTAVSFLLQKFVTFGDKRTHHKIVIPQVAAVTALVVFNFGFTVLMTHLLSHHFPTVVVRTVALGITTIWNFYLYKTRIFTAGDNTPLVD
jgi:putative flippase GtrA